MDNYTILKNDIKAKGYKIDESGNKRKRLDIYKPDGTFIESITPSKVNKSKQTFLKMQKQYSLPSIPEIPKEEKTKVIKPLDQKVKNVKPTLQYAKKVEPQKKIDMPIMPNILPFPSTGAEPVNDVEDINKVDLPASNVNNGTPAPEPKTPTVKSKKVKVNESDRILVRDEPTINLLNQITPASVATPVIVSSENLVAQQNTNVDALLPNNVSLQVKQQEASQPIEYQKNLSTEDTDKLNKLSSQLKQDVALNMENKDAIDNVNKTVDNVIDSIDTPENVDVDAKLITVVEKELVNGVEAATEDTDLKLREFLTTFDPNSIDYSSPDAVKNYALMTTLLLRQLNDKVEFLPDIDKGIKKVNKLQAEINQGNNIVKEGRIELELEKQKDNLDGIHERYVDYNGIKYLELNDYHPALVVGGLKL